MRPSIPSDCEVTVRAAQGSAGEQRFVVPSAGGELDREHAAHQDQRDGRQAHCVEVTVHGVLRLRGTITVSRASSARPAPTRNELRNARVAARSSWSSRSRSRVGRGRAGVGLEVGGREGTMQVGHLTLLIRQLVAERLSQGHLVLCCQRCVEHERGDRLLGRHLGLLEVRDEHRRQDRQPHDHAQMPGTDGPARMLDPGQPQVHRLRGELVDGETETEADQCLGRDGPDEVGRRQDRETDQPAGHQEAAHRDLDLGRGTQAAGQRPGGERRDRHDGHGQRRDCGGVLPPVDQEQNQQKQRRGERGRQKGQSQVGTHRRAVSDPNVRVGRGGRPGTHRERRGHSQYGDRHLDDKDRLPRDRLREQSTGNRTSRRTDHPGGDPGGDPPALTVESDQQLKTPDQRQRAAERLQATRRDQHLDRLRHRAPRRGGRRTPRRRRHRGSAGQSARSPPLSAPPRVPAPG